MAFVLMTTNEEVKELANQLFGENPLEGDRNITIKQYSEWQKMDLQKPISSE